MIRLPAKLAVLAALLLVVACGAAPSDSEATATTSAAMITATGVDYSWARPSPSGLKSEGYTFAARYLSYDNTGKNLSKGEADALWAAGVDVVANWENSATAALNGYSQGVSDAQAADGQANADGIPAGRPIYFSVDFDASPGDQTAIDAYFDGIASVIGLARTGAYGGYYVIQRLFDAGKIKWGWQTYAWSGGQWDSRAQFRQVQNGITAAGDANCCDEDQAVVADFGQWHAAPPENPPRGYLDSAGCAGIAGWAQDPDVATTAIDVDVYFGGPAGAPNVPGMRVLADNDRPDLCKAIGSCNHGFSFPAPLGMLDGKTHEVHAYGIDAKGGPNPELADSPKTLACPNAKPPLDARAGVKRHVVDPASMKAWGFSMLTDVAPEPDAVVAEYPPSDDWSEKPALVQADDGSPEVWLVDRAMRRHVVSPASLAAWHRSFSEVVKKPAAEVDAMPVGPDLPATPFLVIGSGPAVWVIDVALGASGGPSGDGGAPSDDGGANGSNAGAGGSGGCSVGAAGEAPDVTWSMVLGSAAVAIVRRRRVKPSARSGAFAGTRARGGAPSRSAAPSR